MFSQFITIYHQQRAEVASLVYEAIAKWASFTDEEYQAKVSSLSPLARSAMLSTARELRKTDTAHQDSLDRLIGALE